MFICSAQSLSPPPPPPLKRIWVELMDFEMPALKINNCEALHYLVSACKKKKRHLKNGENGFAYKDFTLWNGFFFPLGKNENQRARLKTIENLADNWRHVSPIRGCGFARVAFLWTTNSGKLYTLFEKNNAKSVSLAISHWRHSETFEC